MRRLLWSLVALMLVLALLWFGGTLYSKRQARLLYAQWAVLEPLPATVEIHQRELRSDFGHLIALAPGLAKIDYRYLSQPLDETQQYLFDFALAALARGDQKQWQLSVRILNGIWLSEREAVQVDLTRAARLTLYHHRIRGLYAQARFQRVKAALPSLDPKQWGGRLAFAHNVSRNYVMTQWENDWALWGGYLSWARACQAMHQLTRWDEQLAAGQTLEPGPPALKLVYEVLKGLP